MFDEFGLFQMDLTNEEFVNGFTMSVMDRDEKTNEVISEVKYGVYRLDLYLQNALNRALEVCEISGPEEIFENRVVAVLNELEEEGYR